MPSFVDTHAHLIHDVDWHLMDEIAGEGVLKQAWIMHCPITSDGIRFADEDEVLMCAKRYPGVFVPFGFIDLRKGADEVERLKEKGFTGLKAICPPEPYDSEAFFPVYAKAEELGMPILFHVGIISPGLWKNETVAGAPGPRCMKPSMLDTLSDVFPELILIHGHQGIPWINELWESIYYYPNVNCSVCGLIDYEWLIHNLDCITADGTPFYKHMMFGVDGLYGSRPFWKNMTDTACFMEEFFHRVGRLHNWGRAGRDFMEGNALNLYQKFK